MKGVKFQTKTENLRKNKEMYVFPFFFVSSEKMPGPKDNITLTTLSVELADDSLCSRPIKLHWSLKLY